MTRRVFAAFLGVLVVLIAAIVVPLGVVGASRQRDDFMAAARTAARSYAALAEEQLGDRGSAAALAQALERAVAPGDRVAVLDGSGRVVAAIGPRPPAGVLQAVRAGRPVPGSENRVTVAIAIGDGTPAGTVVLVRDTAALDRRNGTLWLILGVAALAALALGAATGWLLARWVSRPLRSLVGAAHGIGAGDPGARADPESGPGQVRDVARAFNDMADRVAGVLERQRGMTAEVSHQLRTPLAALRLRLELLADDLSGEARDEVAAMLAETDRLARLVDGLLAVARAEATESSPVPVDVGAVVEERIAAWAPVAAERGIAIEQPRAAPAAPAAALTAGHLEQVLDNLLANSVDAVPAGGTITVTATRDGAQVVLRIDDTGPGMGPEQRARAFDPFTTDRGGRGGTGLGLSIVGRLVAVDHGTATLVERPGGGTRVEIRLRTSPHRAPPTAPVPGGVAS
ncbi:MAG: HAMP domain-containing histidine kinase [Jatrophihabitans sp.]|nr:MAG: HAMP domain-containing histidine kinase [Jatrophihabitans sp.]